MKIVATIFYLFISISIFAQTDEEYIETVSACADSGIARLNSGKGHFFKYINNKNNISKIEYWKYDTISDSLFQFQIKYSEKIQNGYKRDYDEYFLVCNGKLIYETDGDNFYDSGDTMRWYEECYFKENELVHYHSGGHGKSESDDYNPKKEIPELYEERYKELQSYLKSKHPDTRRRRCI